MAVTDPETDSGLAPLSGAKLLVAGFALALVNFVVVLDLTIANVSVPHIAGGLAIPPTQGTWAITSYAVAEAITVPLTGWLAARFGTVRWLLVSLVGFGLSSLLCGLSQSIEMLIASRIFQGLSGGPLMPLTQILLLRIFPRDKAAMAMGIWGVTTIVAPILGPILGGTISDNWSWHWIFFINLPIVAFCTVMIARMLPPFESAKLKSPIDRVGLVLLIVWVSAFQLMLDTGREHDWFASPFVVATGITAAISFCAFIIWEWHEPDPVVNIRLMRDRTLAVSTITISMGYAGFFASIVLVPLWLQQVVGFTATETGYVTAYFGVFAVFLAPVAAILLGRVDPRLTISLAFLSLGLAAVLRISWSTETGYWGLVLPQLLQGIGMPFFFIGLTAIALVNLKDHDTASAAGMMTFMRTICGALATALVMTLWDSKTRSTRSELSSVLNDPAGALATMQRGGLSLEQARLMLDRMVEAQASTLGALTVFSASAGIFLVGAALVWLVPKPKGPLQAAVSH